MSSDLERREVQKFGAIMLADGSDNLLVDGSSNTLGWDGYFTVLAWMLTAARKITSFLASERTTSFSTPGTQIVQLIAGERTTRLIAPRKTTHFTTE